MKIKKEQEFTTKHSYFIEFKPLSDVIDVSKFIEGDSLFLISFQDEINITGSVNSNATFNKEMVVKKNLLDKIIAEPSRFDALLKSNPNENPVVFMKCDFKEYFPQFGLNSGIKKFLGEKEKEHKEFFNDKPFSDCENKSYEFMQYISNKNHLKVWMDISGKLYTEPKFLDYISAHIDNEKYYLDELVEYLIKRDDVGFITNFERFSYSAKKLLRGPLKGNEEGIDGIIGNIPGYNAEEGRDETVNLLYYPTQENIIKMMHWSGEKKNQDVYCLDRYIVEEILGCSPFRKSPIIQNAPEIPKRKFKK